MASATPVVVRLAAPADVPSMPPPTPIPRAPTTTTVAASLSAATGTGSLAAAARPRSGLAAIRAAEAEASLRGMRERSRIARAPLHAARGWVASRRALRRAERPEVDPDRGAGWWSWSDGPRSLRAEDRDRRLAALEDAALRATEPVARQNVIFLVALGLPACDSMPWLRALRATGGVEDAEDALCALAFLGDGEAIATFVELARQPAPVDAWRLVDDDSDHEALGEAGERGLLRSYRCIEVLDRDPYFDITRYTAPCDWTPHPGLDVEDRRALLRAWLARWPGHPGSDDVALRISDLHAARGERVPAAWWAARAAALPDQDVTHGAARRLVRLVEAALEPAELEALAAGLERGAPGRAVIRYARARRIAARDGFAHGLAAVELLAREEPDDPLAVAWRHRWGSPVPRGLDGALAPLPRDDPLRRIEGEPAPADDALRQPWWWRELAAQGRRLAPPPDAVRVDTRRVAAQLRAWETLAELERRAAAAVPDARPDLLYKQAAVLYHDPRVLFPAHGARDLTFTGGVVSGRDDGERAASGGSLRERFDAESHALLRALGLFARIEAESPGWPAMDRVVFSQGIAWRRLVDDRPWALWDRARRLAAARNVVIAFDRCAQRFPTSRLADDARRAADYWRKRCARDLR